MNCWLANDAGYGFVFDVCRDSTSSDTIGDKSETDRPFLDDLQRVYGACPAYSARRRSSINQDKGDALSGKNGMRGTAARDAVDMDAKLAVKGYDLLVLDVIMPDEGGLSGGESMREVFLPEFLQLLRADLITPFALCSGPDISGWPTAPKGTCCNNPVDNRCNVTGPERKSRCLDLSI